MTGREYLERCRAAKAWLLRQGVVVEAMDCLRFAVGRRASDGRFENDPAGDGWIVFPERDDVVFWHPFSGRLASWCGRVFAIGQDAIDNPGTYSFDCALNVFESPLDWLHAKGDGIVVLDWSRAFDRLRDCPRIAVAEPLLFQYRRSMNPMWMPDVLVLTDRRAVA